MFDCSFFTAEMYKEREVKMEFYGLDVVGPEMIPDSITYLFEENPAGFILLFVAELLIASLIVIKVFLKRASKRNEERQQNESQEEIYYDEKQGDN